MPIFGEKFVLPVLATILTALVLLNPMKWDWRSRAALLVAITALAYLLSHRLHLRNEAIRTGGEPSGQAVEPLRSPARPDAQPSNTTYGPQSPIMPDNSGIVTITTESNKASHSPSKEK